MRHRNVPTRITSTRSSPITRPPKPQRCFTTNVALQPLRSHARSHSHLDPATRLSALNREYQRVWGDETLPSSSLAAFRSELQSRALPYDITSRAPPQSPPPEEAFELKRRVALAGYHRALIRMPKLFWLAQPGTENPATVFARLPGDKQHRQFMLVFTNLMHYQTFVANAAMPNHAVEEADGDALGGIMQHMKAVARMHLIVDPTPNFSTHRGVISGNEFQSFNLQQTSLHVAAHFKRDVLPERDSFLESFVFSFLANEKGSPYVINSALNGPLLPVFFSDVHFDVCKKSYSTETTPLHASQQRYSVLLETLQSLPLVRGIAIDPLPSNGWTSVVASEELLADSKNVYLANRKVFDKN